MSDVEKNQTRRRLLNSINDPSDIRGLTIDQLESLAREIRDFIVEVTSKNAGHLGAPLGAVELTLALHKVYETPKDIIVWDTGHQAYAHKIICGRRERFTTLRQFDGVAGFLKRSESEYDAFGAGHASTSISAAVGFACARDRKGTDEKVIAIIGDGAMTGGLAFEGLNNAGDLQTDLLVILNDNVMSINESTGAVSSYLNRLLTAPLYYRIKDDVEDLLSDINDSTLIDKHFPGVAKLGNKVLEKAQKLKVGLKNMVLPSVMFEELGFTYYGPIPGHDLSQLIPMLEKLRLLKKPILLHVITHKGKGYEWSENHPEKYHGAKAGFDPETGKVAKKAGAAPPPSWTEVFADELIKLAAVDTRIVALTAAMPSGTGLLEFKQRFPDRFYDVGIAEGHAVVSAAGMAAGGLRPVVAIYSTFLQRAIDMMIHDVAIQKLPVFFCLDRAGLVGDDGETHQGVFDPTYIRMIPNFTLMVPKDDCELREMMRIGVKHELPSAVRYGRGSAAVSEELTSPIEIGRAEELRDGKDLYILAFGPLVFEALTLAKELEAEGGWSVGVVNMRFIKPIDAAIVKRIGGTVGRIVTYEESAVIGGAGTAVLEVLADAGIKASVKRVGVPDHFIEHGNVDLVKKANRMGISEVKREALTLLGADRAARGVSTRGVSSPGSPGEAD